MSERPTREHAVVALLSEDPVVAVNTGGNIDAGVLARLPAARS